MYQLVNELCGYSVATDTAVIMAAWSKYIWLWSSSRTLAIRGLFFMFRMREDSVGRRTKTQFMLSTGPQPYAHLFHPSLSVTARPTTNRSTLRRT